MFFSIAPSPTQLNSIRLLEHAWEEFLPRINGSSSINFRKLSQVTKYVTFIENHYLPLNSLLSKILKIVRNCRCNLIKSAVVAICHLKIDFHPMRLRYLLIKSFARSWISYICLGAPPPPLCAQVLTGCEMDWKPITMLAYFKVYICLEIALFVQNSIMTHLYVPLYVEKDLLIVGVSCFLWVILLKRSLPSQACWD